MSGTKRKLRTDCGFTAIEVLVSVSIAALLFTPIISSFIDGARRLHDLEVVRRTDDAAQSVRDIIGFEMRMIGTGMPLGQADFAPGTPGLTDAPLPVLLGSDNTLIQFRLNQLGTRSVLSKDFVPGSPSVVAPVPSLPVKPSLTMSVFSPIGFSVGDIIYLSNMPQGGKKALQGTIAKVENDLITIDPQYVASWGAEFPSGSSIDRVSMVTYDSPPDWSGVTREDEDGTVLLVANSTFVIEYLDDDGQSIPLPLTETIIADDLSAVELTVYVDADKPLRGGTIYRAETKHNIALRNVNINR